MRGVGERQDARPHLQPHEGDQQPGETFTEAQVRRKLELLQPHTDWIRIFSCTDGNDMIPKLAREYGFKTLVGAWLGEEKDKNEDEMARLIELAQEGVVDVAGVGNEVLYREEMSEAELIACIDRVRNALPDVPVGTWMRTTNLPTARSCRRRVT